MSRQRVKVVRRGGGFAGKFVALLLGFILGIVGTIGGIVGGGYYLASSVKIKDAVNGVAGVTGTEIDYSQYITEEYAEKTLLGLIGSLGEVATEFSDGSGSLSTLEKISPYVRTVVEQLAQSTEEFGVTIDAETLMTTPFAELSAFATQTMNSVELGKVLQTVGFETSILKLLCYGEEGVHYTEENGEVVMLGSNKPLTIGALTTDEGIGGILNDLSLAGLIESLGTVNANDAIMRTLLYGTKGVDYEIVDGQVEMKPVYFLYNETADCFIDDAKNLYLKTGGGYTNENGLVIKKNTVHSTSTATGSEYDYSVYDKNDTLVYELKTPDGESDGYFAAYKNDVEQKHRGLTMGDLMGGKDLMSIMETFALGDLLVSDPSNTDTIQLVLAYGEKDLHYTILPDNTVKMLPMQIAVFDGSAYDAYGQKLDATVTAPTANNYVVKVNDGKTYYLSTSVYPTDGEGNQKTLTIGENQAPLYYAAGDMLGTLEYYSARTIGSFLTGNIFGDILNCVTISDIMGGEISEEDSALINAIKDWKISSFMDPNAINSLKLGDIIGVAENAPAALKAIQNWTIGDLQDSEKFNGLKIGDFIEVKDNSPEILKTLATWTIADMQSSSKFDTLKIGDLIEVKGNSPEILKTLATWSIADLKSSEKFDTLKIEDLIEIDKDDPDTSSVIKILATWTIADLKTQSKFDELYIKDLINIDVTSTTTPPFMKMIAEWQIKDLKDQTKFDTVKINQLVEITDTSPAILKELGTWSISDLKSQSKFNELKIGKLFTVTDSSPAILQAIQNWTIADMQSQEKLNGLQIKSLFPVTNDSPEILKAIQDWTLGDMQSKTKFDGLQIGKLFTITNDSPEILKAIQDWTFADMQSKTKFNALQIGKLFTITDSSPAILKAIQTWSIADMQNSENFDKLYINQLITIDTTSTTTPAILKAISGWQLKDMKDQTKFDELYIKDLMTIDTESADTPAILKAISGWQLKDMKDQTKFDDLYIYQLIAIDQDTAPPILNAISGWQLKDMKNQSKFDNLTLVQVLGEEAVAQSEYFRTIGDTPISGLSQAIDGLSINVMFEDTIYRTTKIGTETYFAYSELDANGHPIIENGEHKLLPLFEKDGKYYTDEACTEGNERDREFNGVWHYLLQDPADPEGEVKQYTFHDIDSMISNMTENMQHATLNQLVADDIIDLPKESDGSTIAEDPIKTKISLTFGSYSQSIPIGQGTDENGNPIPGEGKIYYFQNPDGTRKAKTTIGELTINEMIDYLSNIFDAISHLESQNHAA